jgi:ribosome biogenesis GTPase / thiamine phosphate phosphatase
VPALETLGWDDAWDVAFEPFRAEGLDPGRVSIQHRGAYDVLTAGGEVRAHISPLLRRQTERTELPVVGDWVALGRTAEIAGVLPRRTKFSRRAPHEPGSDSAREQVVAANVDVVFVTFPLSGDLDPLVLERYVTLALESGARPVILLTKSDLERDPDAITAELTRTGGEIPVCTVSARTRRGLEQVRAQLARGVTGALLGPSGAGKSTLVNALVGDEDLLATGEVRDDGAGRHTTTRRQLVLLPGGGLVVDNPGMREVHLWVADEGLEEAFEDIVELGSECRFADCRHGVEPGCAVQAAVADGRLAPDRWQRFLALRQELEELEQRLVRRERSRARRGRPDAEGS